MSLDRINGGGSVERTLQLTRHLLKAGVECRLVATDTGLVPDSIRDLEESVTALPTMMERFYVPRFSHRVLKELVAAVDVVHLMNHWTVLNALAFHYCRHLGKPYVVCPAGALPTVHGRSRGIKGFYNFFVGRRIIREANAAVAISPLEIPDFRSYGVRDDLITVIPNGIDPEDFTDRDDDRFQIG
jgi:glycosyltransferase involved in cell wall biosynthesis